MGLSQKAKFKLGDLWRMTEANNTAPNFRFPKHFATCFKRRLEQKVNGYGLHVSQTARRGRAGRATANDEISIYINWAVLTNILYLNGKKI